MDKTLAALYAIAMSMADACIIKNSIPDRFSKLDEEYRELVVAFEAYGYATNENTVERSRQALIGELADVLFVLLHVGRKLDVSAHDLLHIATTKMLARMGDPGYVAKDANLTDKLFEIAKKQADGNNE